MSPILARTVTGGVAMAFKINKVVALPGTLEADAFYAVLAGDSFNLYLTDSAGTQARLLSVADTFETLSKNARATDATMAYSGDVLASITYADGIVKTFSYGPNGLSTVALSGAVTSGVQLTKTLLYTDGKLTGITYS